MVKEIKLPMLVRALCLIALGTLLIPISRASATVYDSNTAPSSANSIGLSEQQSFYQAIAATSSAYYLQDIQVKYYNSIGSTTHWTVCLERGTLGCSAYSSYDDYEIGTPSMSTSTIGCVSYTPATSSLATSTITFPNYFIATSSAYYLRFILTQTKGTDYFQLATTDLSSKSLIQESWSGNCSAITNRELYYIVNGTSTNPSSCPTCPTCPAQTSCPNASSTELSSAYDDATIYESLYFWLIPIVLLTVLGAAFFILRPFR